MVDRFNRVASANPTPMPCAVRWNLMLASSNARVVTAPNGWFSSLPLLSHMSEVHQLRMAQLMELFFTSGQYPAGNERHQG
jgi:hypothetical protein